MGLASGVLGLASWVSKGRLITLWESAHEAGDQLASNNRVSNERGVLLGIDKVVIEEDVAHGANLATGSSRNVISLPLLSAMKAFPAFSDVVHH